MKKFLTSVFMLSMVLFSMNVFNSCKDYDEDEYNDLIVEFNKNDANLRTWITTNYATIAQLRDSIVAVQTRCRYNCGVRMDRLHDSIDLKANQTEITRLVDSIADLRVTDKSLQAQIDSLNALLKDSTGNITNVITVLGKVADINTKVTGLGAALEALQKDTYTKVEVDSLLGFYTKQTDFLILESKVNNVIKDAAYAIQLAKNDSVRIKEVETLLNNRIDSLAKVTNAQGVSLDSLAKVTAAHEATLDSLAQVTDALDAALKAAEENSRKADSLLQNQIDALAVGFSDILNKKIPEIEEAYKEADQLLQDSIDALAAQVKKNTEDIEALNDSIDKIMDRLDDVDEALKSLITGIIVQGTTNPVYGTFALPFGINSNVLMAFYGTSDNPVVFPTKETANYVKNSQTFTDADWNMISSVSQYRCAGNKTLFNESTGNAGTIYVTVNPGSVDFAGQTLELVNSKDEASKMVLEPLKKENDVELKFGYTRAAETNGFYSAQATLSEEDINAVKIDIQEGLGSAFKDVLKQRTFHSVGELASKLYQQFDGILPAQGLKASWTDYNGDHSVYSQYGVAATAIKPLSYQFLENLDVKTVPGYERAINLVNRVANKVKSSIPNSIMGTMKSDLTGLNLLSYKLEDLTDAQLALFRVEISDEIQIDGQTFTINFKEKVPVQNDQITVPTYTYNVYQSGVKRGTVTIPEAVYDPDAYVDIDFSQTINVNGYTKSIYYVCDMKNAAESLWGSIQDDINPLFDKIQKIVDDGNDIIDQINNKLAKVDGKVDNYADRIKEYIDKLNNKMTGIFNSANERIQPVLLVGNRATGMMRASRVQSLPTVIKETTVEFILTSYTVEIVTPAFKKHIAVTNVYKDGKSAQGGDADCKAALDEVNGQDKMNTVLDGDKCSVTATFKPGYVYEVAYSALDYSGKISMQKCYVRN